MIFGAFALLSTNMSVVDPPLKNSHEAHRKKVPITTKGIFEGLISSLLALCRNHSLKRGLSLDGYDSKISLNPGTSSGLSI
jgi:hypothetical protein